MRIMQILNKDINETQAFQTYNAGLMQNNNQKPQIRQTHCAEIFTVYSLRISECKESS